MIKELSKYFDVPYFIKFILVFLGLYTFNLFYVGVITPGGLYNIYIDKYLNYPYWLIKLILFFSKNITYLFGIGSYINGISLKAYQGATVNIYWPCIGLQIISFWIAFIIAHQSKWTKKIFWCLFGIMAILCINSLRIALLLTSMERDWKIFNNINHHAFFTLSAYIIICLMVYVYYKINNRPLKSISIISY